MISYEEHLVSPIILQSGYKTTKLAPCFQIKKANS